jgi:hypothetical protein
VSFGGEDLITLRLQLGSARSPLAPPGRGVGSEGYRVSTLICIISVCLLSFTGCSSLTAKREKQDILEAELRGQERHILELKAEIERKEGHIHGLDLEVERAQQAAQKQQAGEPLPPAAIKEITLGRLTGGYRNNPRNQYDDSLQFLIEPRDADGHAIKVPGSLHIELFEVTPAGLKNMLSQWDVTQREMRRSWDQPFIGGPAYRILIPFKALPTQERMRVVIRFTTSDGKLYEAERDFTIRLPGPGSAPLLPMNAIPQGGYTVVTPGHMINGNMVGPLHSNVPAPVMNTSPAALPQPPKSLEGTGRTSDPVQSEPVKQEKKEFVPTPAPSLDPRKTELPKTAEKETIPTQPRDIPATITIPSGEPPPLPPPPTVPEFGKDGLSYERLPAPSSSPRSEVPVYPQSNGIVQAGYVTTERSVTVVRTTPLTAAPPAHWRAKHGPTPIVEQSGSIKLSRPVIVK